MLENKLEYQINFLKKYLPITPDKKIARSLSPLDNIRFSPRSPCPSPTPIFQQLYHALAHWERIMSESPELIQQKIRLFDEKLKMQADNKFSNFGSLDDPDESDDEGSQNEDYDNAQNNEIIIKKSNSFLNLTELKDKSSSEYLLEVGGAILKERRRSSPGDLIDGKNDRKVFEKCHQKAKKNLISIKIFDDSS